MGEHGEYRPLVRLAAALACGLAGPAAAECRLALLLGLDVSSSVDAREDLLQRRGLARALLAPEVQAAALGVPGEWVALSVYEWSGRWQHRTLLDWTPLTDRAAIAAASDRIAGSVRGTAEFPTAAGYALGHAVTMFRDGPTCLFRTLDLSGDGVNNDGFAPALAYKNFDFSDITVNGLPITGHDDAVTVFYRNEVRHGPGAFIEIADDFADFERAMRRKLEREMGVSTLGFAE